MEAWWLTAIGTLITGFCYSLNQYLKWKEYQLPSRIAYYNDGIAYYFKTLFFVLLLRSFVVEWAIIPSESSKPVLLPGDRILTDKSAYGIRLPITGHLLIAFNKPKRGDMLVFRSPLKPGHSSIQRVIGLPGDHIQYVNHKLSINGKPVPQIALGVVKDEEGEEHTQWLLCQENLEGCLYQIYQHPSKKSGSPSAQKIDIIVPYAHYFVMGDHRDKSIDSRIWGCLPDRYLLGQAKRIYLSRTKPMIWWKPHHWLRWKRIGMRVK